MTFGIFIIAFIITFILPPVWRFIFCICFTIVVLSFTWSMFSAYDIPYIGWIFVGIFVTGIGGGVILFWPEYKRLFSGD